MLYTGIHMPAAFSTREPISYQKSWQIALEYKGLAARAADKLGLARHAVLLLLRLRAAPASWAGERAGECCRAGNALLLCGQTQQAPTVCGLSTASPQTEKKKKRRKSLLDLKTPSADQMILAHFRGFV